MTKRCPCIIVTMFSCLLAVATSASAECAWMLWGRSPNFDDYRIIKAFNSGESCQNALAIMVKNFQRDGHKPIYESGDLSFSVTTGGNRPTFFHCLPDTVDPRGPKGK